MGREIEKWDGKPVVLVKNIEVHGRLLQEATHHPHKHVTHRSVTAEVAAERPIGNEMYDLGLEGQKMQHGIGRCTVTTCAVRLTVGEDNILRALLTQIQERIERELEEERVSP